MIPRNIINKVINETDIVEVISEYVQLQPRGKSMFGLCPFHDDQNPSMSVSREIKMFNCFSCNTKGNVIDFVAKYENINVDKATLKLAKRLGMNIQYRQSAEDIRNEKRYQIMEEATRFYEFYLRNSKEGQVALEYLAKRGITDEMIKRFRIGLAPSEINYLHFALNEKQVDFLDQVELGLVRENKETGPYDLFRSRIMFPLSDAYGRVVGFSGRIYLAGDNNAKYINSPESSFFHKSNLLYNLHQATVHAKRIDKIYLFEGFMDVLAADLAGIKNAVATMGTALTKEHVNTLISITKNIVLCFDGDQAGIMASKRAAELFVPTKVLPQVVVLPEGLDPDDYRKKYGDLALSEYLNTASVNIYEFLFQDAKRDLVLDDLNSVEKFRNAVFGFIRMSRSQTVKDFFLKKMSETLGISLDSLAKDFGFMKEDITPVPSTKPVYFSKTKSKFSKGVINAYELIIYRAMLSVTDYFQIIMDLSIVHPRPDYLKYHNFLEYMSKFITDGVFEEERFVEKIKDDEILHGVYQDVMTKPHPDYDKPKYLEDCIEKVRENAERDLRMFMIRTLENDHDLYDLLLKQKRENTTFENEVE
ncbi:MAG TPA: DNA primase [Acholeplasmataceae bacterium]|jgi:DNA primase|nr:DNA primase [Acholeplasmataceae bacterium]